MAGRATIRSESRVIRQNPAGSNRSNSAFDAILRNNDAAPRKLPPCSPNLNAYAERFVQTLKHECLNHFIVFGERHLNHVVGEFVDDYHRAA